MVTTVLAKGYDVLLCTQDVDEFCMMAMARPTRVRAVDGDEDEQTALTVIKNVALRRPGP